MDRTEKLTQQQFPLEDYASDRAACGHMALLRQTECRQLAEGVVYRECLYRRGDGADVWVYLTTISPNAPVQLAVAAAPLRTAKPVPSHARDFEKHFGIPVLYAMNASFFHFFNQGDLTPYGIQVVRGVEMARPGLLNEKPWYETNFLAVDRNGRAFISSAAEYDRSLRGTLEYAVGGGMRLIREGKICLYQDPLGEKYATAPRTAVGFDADGNTILLCADGRSKRSVGLSFGDLIEIYQQQGTITELLNLDGGGSTTVVLRDADGVHRIRNVPSGPAYPLSKARYGIEKKEPAGEEQVRPVADAVLIIPKN